MTSITGIYGIAFTIENDHLCRRRANVQTDSVSLHSIFFLNFHTCLTYMSDANVKFFVHAASKASFTLTFFSQAGKAWSLPAHPQKGLPGKRHHSHRRQVTTGEVARHLTVQCAHGGQTPGLDDFAGMIESENAVRSHRHLDEQMRFVKCDRETRYALNHHVGSLHQAAIV